MTRRPDGALEHDVMTVLWQANAPLTPAEVVERLDSMLAYTSVATVLTRLCAKGLVERVEAGRAFRYVACVTEAEQAAARMNDVLAQVKDRDAALAGFVGALGSGEARALRRLLDGTRRRR